MPQIWVVLFASMIILTHLTINVLNNHIDINLVWNWWFDERSQFTGTNALSHRVTYFTISWIFNNIKWGYPAAEYFSLFRAARYFIAVPAASQLYKKRCSNIIHTGCLELSNPLASTPPPHFRVSSFSYSLLSWANSKIMPGKNKWKREKIPTIVTFSRLNSLSNLISNKSGCLS